MVQLNFNLCSPERHQHFVLTTSQRGECGILFQCLSLTQLRSHSRRPGKFKTKKFMLRILSLLMKTLLRFVCRGLKGWIGVKNRLYKISKFHDNCIRKMIYDCDSHVFRLMIQPKDIDVIACIFRLFNEIIQSD